MPFSKEALAAAIHNAHIEMSEEEVVACQQEMEFIIGWAKELEKLPLEGVKMTVGVNWPDNCPCRPDEVAPSLGSENALSQAPAKLGSCFIVPQILE